MSANNGAEETIYKERRFGPKKRETVFALFSETFDLMKRKKKPSKQDISKNVHGINENFIKKH